ncbi:hypothetical protein GCM10023221_04580 [Luteimicrobium xylanilyticum]|uniref:Glycine-rich protein n=1 Tax=Luteimicrobium xylanilyticum TaxID=1133546 RepID=A0A5P9Q7A4_9MICO|nr:hypothetical protein [Luteimicrobium xylanilyticum]QFU97249.1 Glycine-rich protein [Luteimicrobium xylanilyticum]
MGFVGADVEELAQLGERFTEASKRLESLRTTVASSVRSSGWSGPDADDFRHSWSAHEAKIVAARDLLALAAKTLQANADDQRQTSATLTGGTSGAGGSGGTGSSGGGGGGGGGGGYGDDPGGTPGVADTLSGSASGSVPLWPVGRAYGDVDYGVDQKVDGATSPYDDGRYLMHDDDHGIVRESLPGQHTDGATVQGQASVEVRDADAPEGEDKGSSPLDDAVKLGGVHAGGVLGAQGETSGGFGTEDGAHGEGSLAGWAGAKGDVGAGATAGAAGLAATAYASAAVGAGGSASGSVGYGILEAKGEATAFAGARAEAGAGASVGPNGVSANVGVDAFAGAEASVSGSAGVEGAQVGATATGYAGIGFSANASLDIGTDGIKGTVDFGAALGLGGKISLDVDIEPAKLVDDIGSMFGF